MKAKPEKAGGKEKSCCRQPRKAAVSLPKPAAERLEKQQQNNRRPSAGSGTGCAASARPKRHPKTLPRPLPRRRGY